LIGAAVYLTDRFFRRTFLFFALVFAFFGFVFFMYWAFVPNSANARQIGFMVSGALGSWFLGAVIPDNDY
jgi:predicted acyltransferase